MSFRKMKLEEGIIQALKKEGIVKPSEVQKMSFQPIVENQDIVVQSETGSGKTLAYLLPIIEKIKTQGKGNKVLILVPTHELALQVVRQVKNLGKAAELSVEAAAIVGNVNIRRQVEMLKEKPQIVVGTTGRILELIQKKKIAAHLIQSVVIDEADKMLEKQQVEETKAVLKKCMRNVQKLFYSASISVETRKVIEEIAPEAKVLKVKQENMIPTNIRHMYIVCENREKLQVLRSVIAAAKPRKAMVFINKVYDIEAATEKLQYHSYQADCIHGSERKDKRKQVIDKFHHGKLKILVGTDMAARGLHFDNVDLVVHYSIPEEPRDYLHRAGRTGRNGKDGRSLSIVTKKELAFIKMCRKEFNIDMEECMLKNGMILPLGIKETSLNKNLKKSVAQSSKKSPAKKPNNKNSKKHLTNR